MSLYRCSYYMRQLYPSALFLSLKANITKRDQTSHAAAGEVVEPENETKNDENLKKSTERTD